MRTIKVLFQISLLLLLLLPACQKPNLKDQNVDSKNPFDPSIDDKVIYGDDDRKDIYQVSDPKLLLLADSTVALMESSKLKETGGFYQILGSKYSSSYNLCATEPFYEQNLAAYCSGTLVGKNLILTAGHCIKTDADCKKTKLVFGYAVKSAGKLPDQVAASEVYSCSKIIKQVLSADQNDYALVELDRDVVGHAPLKVRRTGSASLETPLTVIGHPAGLPTKVAGAGKIRSINNIYYVTNLDTYGGNSGSGVFNSVTGEIEGVLVRGETDYVPRGSCNVSNRCSVDGCRGEDVTRIDLVRDLIPVLDNNEPPPPSVETKVYAAKPNLIIPDKDLNGILVSISVPEAVSGRNLKIYVDIAHTYVGDLKLVLIDPSGKQFLLRNKKGGRTRDLVGTFGKELVPESNLSSLSQSSAGTWQLQVSDLLKYDIGTLREWRVILEK